MFTAALGDSLPLGFVGTESPAAAAQQSVMPKQPARKTAALAEAISSAQQNSLLEPHPTKKATASAGRIMYIECKAGGLTGVARIGRVTFSQTGRTLYYRGQKFQSLK